MPDTLPSASATVSRPDRLSREEQALHQDPVTDRLGERVRHEQGRIDWSPWIPASSRGVAGIRLCGGSAGGYCACLAQGLVDRSGQVRQVVVGG